jgi:hypothetical protein
MVEFETLNTKEIRFGKNKFLEVARKKAKTKDGESEFISISKGFINQLGQKKFKASLGFPEELIGKLVEALESI